MNINVYDQVANFYDNLVIKHGDSHLSCDYGSQKSQKIKFEVIYQHLQEKELEILDVGCGTGEFYKFLKDKSVITSYTGIDISKKMINVCKNKYPEAIFENKNIFNLESNHDFIIANGIFYLLGDSAEDEMNKIIRYMFKHAKKGVIFNSLSNWANKKDPGEFYADPLKTLHFCSSLTSKIIFRHDYLQHDFTLALYR